MKNTLVQIWHFFEQIALQLKDPLIVFFTTLGLFLAPVAELVVGATLIAFLDLSTALIAARKNKIPITSQRLGDTLNKLLLYSSIIILVHYIDTYLIHNIRVGFIDHILRIFIDDSKIESLSTIKLTAAVSFLIIIREMKSIDENWNKIFSWGFIGTFTKYIVAPILKLKTKFTTKNGTN